MSDYFPRRELQEMGFSEVAIRALEKVSELAGTIERVAATETDITTLDGAKANASTTITAGVGLSGGGTLAANRTIDLEDTAVTPGSYINANITVDQQGRLTSAATGTGAAHRGALVTKAADQTSANYSAAVNVAFDSEAYDTDNIHDNVTNNTRLTVPAGVTKVRISYSVHASAVTANTAILAMVRKNGGSVYTGNPTTVGLSSLTSPRWAASSPVLVVSPGDYFELELTCADTSITIAATFTWFAMEIIE